jgi:P27 family predicted phage terminase small subunit
MHIVNGNPGHRPLPEREPKPPEGLPTEPESVKRDQVASSEWERICALTVLKNARVITVQDGPILEATCSAYSLWREARDILLEKGLTYETTNTTGGLVVKKRPEAEIEASAWTRYVGGLTHFGLSPASRGKVARIDDDEGKSAAEAFLR